jgi:hypothetical protein
MSFSSLKVDYELNGFLFSCWPIRGTKCRDWLLIKVCKMTVCGKECCSLIGSARVVTSPESALSTWWIIKSYLHTTLPYGYRNRDVSFLMDTWEYGDHMNDVSCFFDPNYHCSSQKISIFERTKRWTTENLND